MTQTASILWAVLATGGAVAVYILMGREVAKAKAWSVQLECMRDDARAKLDRGLKDAGRYIGKLAAAKASVEDRAVAAEAELHAIKQKRSASAKHARQAQLSQQRAKVLEQASKLVAPKVDRIAA